SMDSSRQIAARPRPGWPSGRHQSPQADRSERPVLEDPTTVDVPQITQKERPKMSQNRDPLSFIGSLGAECRQLFYKVEEVEGEDAGCDHLRATLVFGVHMAGQDLRKERR